MVDGGNGRRPVPEVPVADSGAVRRLRDDDVRLALRRSADVLSVRLRQNHGCDSSPEPRRRSSRYEGIDVGQLHHEDDRWRHRPRTEASWQSGERRSHHGHRCPLFLHLLPALQRVQQLDLISCYLPALQRLRHFASSQS